MAFAISPATLQTLTRSFGSVSGASRTLNPNVRPAPVDVQVYVLDRAQTQLTDQLEYDKARLRLLAGMMQVNMAGVTYRNVTIVLTMILAAFPEMRTVLDAAGSNVRIVSVNITEAHVTAMLTAPAPGTSTAITLDEIPGIRGISFAVFEPRLYAQWEIYGLLSVCLFCLGKGLNANNYTQVTERRPAAIASYLKATVTAGGFLTPAKIPGIGWMMCFQSAFMMMQSLRAAFVTELVSWIAANDLSLGQRIVVVSIRLWAGAGFNHVGLLRNFVASYSDLLRTFPDLQLEAYRFAREYEEVMALQDPLLVYRKVIDPGFDGISSKSYPGLIQLATEMERRRTPSFGQYAPGLGRSTHLDLFERAADAAGVHLPARANTVGAMI